MVETPTIDSVYSILSTVKDPEIPVLSVLELGMIDKVEIQSGKIEITFIPTFSACPAIEYIKDHIFQAVQEAFPEQEVEVLVNRYKPWSTDVLTPEAKEKLQNYGLGVPDALNGKELELEDLEKVACPHCKSELTSLTNPFGSALCRSMHYCHNCGNSFERIKPIQ